MLNLLITIRIILYLLTDALALYKLINRAKQDKDTLLIFFLLKDLYTLFIALI